MHVLNLSICSLIIIPENVIRMFNSQSDGDFILEINCSPLEGRAVVFIIPFPAL